MAKLSTLQALALNLAQVRSEVFTEGEPVNLDLPPWLDLPPLVDPQSFITGHIKAKAGAVIEAGFPSFKQRNALREWMLLSAKTALRKDDKDRARAILCLWNFTDRVRAHGEELEEAITKGEVCETVEGWPRLESEPMPTAQETMALLRKKRPRKKTTKKTP